MTAHKYWKTVGVGLAATAITLTAPAALAVGSPGDRTEPADPAAREYLRTLTAIVDEASGEAASGPADSGRFVDQLTIATDRLRDALLAANPTP